MNKAKILGAVITTAAAMTGLCSEISQNVFSEVHTLSEAKSSKETNTVKTAKKQ